MYKLVLTNSALTPVGEIKNFGNFTFTRPLNKLATCSFSVRPDNARAQELSEAQRYVKVYRKGTLVFVGPIVTAEEVVERATQTITVNCADAGWFLTKRLAGKSATGTLYNTATARHTIAQAIIDAENSASSTRVDTEAYAPHTSGSAITYKVGPYRPILEVVQELANSLNGFDWRIHPFESWSGGALVAGYAGAIQMDTLIGTSRPNAIFEYGISTRSNVLGYTKTRTRDTQATRVYHPHGTEAARMKEDGTATDAWDLMEDTISADLTDTAMRDSLLDEHISVRKYPRDLIKMTPHIDPGVTGRLPQPFVDYDIGDTVTFRAVVNKTVRFAGNVRVYSINISVDQETGFERVTLILEDDS